MKLITQILHKFNANLGEEFNAYHNHAQRVYHYAVTLLLMRENRKLAICAAFHDLDIWVNNHMDYLNHSAELARKYLSGNDFELLPEEVSFIIKQHHKLTKIKGNIEAEAFLKADLIDFSAGKIPFNIPISLVQSIESQYPRHDFTKIILRKALKHACRHPLKPFPMIKW